MPNTNYIRGRRREHYICSQLKKDGFDIAQRTAGSHSPFDIIAIQIENKKIELVQVKPIGTPNEKILEKWEGLNGKFDVEFKVT